MPLDKRELSYLWDMQKATKEINEFMSGVKFASFEKNKVGSSVINGKEPHHEGHKVHKGKKALIS